MVTVANVCLLVISVQGARGPPGIHPKTILCRPISAPVVIGPSHKNPSRKNNARKNPFCNNNARCASNRSGALKCALRYSLR